jgi:hypothetical protein
VSLGYHVRRSPLFLIVPAHTDERDPADLLGLVATDAHTHTFVTTPVLLPLLLRQQQLRALGIEPVPHLCSAGTALPAQAVVDSEWGLGGRECELVARVHERSL